MKSKNYKIKIILLLIFAISPLFTIHSQVFTDDLNMGGANLNSQFALMDNSEKFEKIKGNPFIFKEFKNGDVQFISKVIKNVPLRVNLLDNKIEFLKNENVYQFTNYTSVNFFEIAGLKFVPSRNNETGETKILQLIYEDEEFNLVKLQNYVYQERIPAKSSYEKEIPASFVEQAVRWFYYPKEDRDHLIEISDKRQIKEDEVLPYNSIKKILRNNKLKTDQDIIDFFLELKKNDLLAI
ncbi:hypothetical protein [Marivirga arenosa]|uniref:Uncharacterized protein n=1 Tax=Marivirga arenosa TaxID=3059076 RepID=A0AA51ZWZ9_9BACT|nr:hypothetical protein [Marivirga sp. BKB1-2]WNB18282.1 hypothetical protein QYS47_29745 [Marivirga sp. BKB1-2]